MDFFEAQDRARRHTVLLVFYFIAAVTLMIGSLYAAVIAVFTFSASQVDAAQPVDWFQPRLLLIVAVATLLVIACGSLYKTLELRSGGSAVALMLGGRRIQPTTADLAERRVLNVVEEMAIAAGVAVPPVYLLRNEPSVNAFAAGQMPDDAVIGVSQGMLDYLTRDELQGAIAHEFSHILNGDMRFNVHLIGILHGILLISIIGYHLIGPFGHARSGRNRDNGAGKIVLIGLAAFIIGYVGLFFGRMIKAAVSRQREFLADASAVQFTRNPDTIAGALKKIGGQSNLSVIRSPNAETASHMFFGDAFKRTSFSPFATHPPLVLRIRRIDPNFDGVFAPVEPLRQPEPAADGTQVAGTAAKLPTSPILKGFGLGDRIPLDPLLVMASVGAPTTEHMNYSKQLLESIPAPLVEATREAFSGRAFVYALLLDTDQKVLDQQLRLIARIEGEPTRQETERLAEFVDAIPGPARLPALEVVQGTLRNLSDRQYRQFRTTVDELVRADHRISLFEFVLQRVLIRHLDRAYGLVAPPAVQYHSLNAVKDEVVMLISALAHLGHADEKEAADVFQQVMAGTTVNADGIMGKEYCSLREIDEALDRLTTCSAAVKKRVLTAAAICVAADRQVTVKEAELFRCISSSIDCPVPPILAGPVNPQIMPIA